MKVAELATTVRDAITVSRVFAEPPGSAVRSHMELAGRGFSLVRESRDAAGGAADLKV